jgi:predicted Fe-Mo cluster-binding NifX family protein
MVVCVPVTGAGTIDPRWGRAARVAVAEVREGEIAAWREVEVGWDVAHDQGGEGLHHARIARFLREQGVAAVVASHMGGGMLQMLEQMGLRVTLGAEGDARAAVLAAG